MPELGQWLDATDLQPGQWLQTSGGGRSDGGSSSGGSCQVPGNSFVPGTRVLMADGTTKPIEDVKTGDTVQATEAETGETQPKKVTATITGHGIKHLVKIVIDTDGEQGTNTATITATDGHPFWAPELDQWLDATDLQPGQWLQTSTGTWIQIAAIDRWTAHSATVYNLTVSDIHTYYVLVGNKPVLVHNCGGKHASNEVAEDTGYVGRHQSSEVETYYRTMSQEHFDSLNSTGRLSPTRETFISPTRSFSESHDGVTVKFSLRPGATEKLMGIGVRDRSAATAGAFSNMPVVSKGWNRVAAFFKGEGAQVNIGLGRGAGLDTFNGRYRRI